MADAKNSQRKPVSTATRFDVFKRDRFTCVYCGRQPPAVILHIDHIIPVAEGGTNESGNLCTACSDCNLGKGARPLSCVPAPLVDRANEAEERVEQVRAMADMIHREREEVERFAWEIAESLDPGASKGWPADRFHGVCMFIRKLGYGHVARSAYEAEGAHVPAGKRRFLYFCKVCWRLIREQEQGNG
jgi:hypothetical protein